MYYDKEYPEKKEELKKLFKKLGRVINDTLSHSDEVQEILSQIKIFGLGVDLSMVVGLGLYTNSETDQEIVFGTETEQQEEIRFELTSGDLTFLERHRIKLTMDAETMGDAES